MVRAGHLPEAGWNMGKSGRYGKYGEIKRLDRLRGNRGAPAGIRSRKETLPSEILWPRKRVQAQSRLSLKRAGGEDVEYLKDLSRQAFGRYGPYEGMIAPWFHSEKTKTFLARRGKIRAGFVMIGPTHLLEGFRPAYEILAIAVAPSWRGMGVGRALMSKALTEAADQGVQTIILHTEPSNDSAVRLFERCGFVRTSSPRRGFYPRGQDAVLMTKRLPPLGR